MKLSIIIVNYNVKYFLEQTLKSVFRSKATFPLEVIVVDNASEDGSLKMVRDKFPHVKIVDNEDNVGFSVANNQGMSIAKGDYYLLLNPDTILSEDTLEISVKRMDENPRIGGLGVRMIDGGGHFLPESKRGLPTPFVAFCKAFGLSRLFPKSKRFNYYHLGHIEEMQSAEVDVLSGAFMLLRAKVIEEIGGLDETFFMYGEDIDLSYRIQKAGYINWYETATSIVHFKGESTKRGSLNYVKVFYQAMIIFANKHFVGRGAFMMSLLYQMAVYLRAGLSLGFRVTKWAAPLILDGIIIFIGLQLMTDVWAQYYYGEPDYFQNVPLKFHHAFYTLVWILFMYLGGTYDRYYKLGYLWRSLLIGSLFLLVIFSLMSSEWRPSRAVVILGVIWNLGILTLIRWLLGKLTGVKSDDEKRLAIVGSMEEIRRTLDLLDKSGVSTKEVFKVAPNEVSDDEYVGTTENLDDIVEAYHLEEVIFCAKDVDNGEIINWMTQFSGLLTIKIIQEEGAGVIGSRYKNRKGEWYAIDARLSIAQPERIRQKRVLDILICIVLLPLALVVPFNSRLRKLYKDWWSVLIGKKTWVAYKKEDLDDMSLPRLKPGVIEPAYGVSDEKVIERVDYLYAKDYSPWMDLEILYKSIESR